MKHTLKELRNVTHTYAVGLKKKVKISNSINGINVVGTGANTIKDQLVEFNTGEYLLTIDDGCFNGCNKLSKVILLACTTNIGQNAFKDCEKLKDINIETVAFERIGNNAFENTGLTSLNIQLFKTLFGEFGKNLFKSCKNLKTVSLTSNFIPEAIFEDCNNLTSIEFTLSSDSNTNSNQIDANALYGIPSLLNVVIRGTADTLPCLSGMLNLRNVTLELDSLPKIPDNMFNNTPNLKSVDFSNCVTDLKQLISLNAFNGSSLTSIMLNSVTKQDLIDSMLSYNTAASIGGVNSFDKNYIRRSKSETGNKYCYGKIYGNECAEDALTYALLNKIPVLLMHYGYFYSYVNTTVRTGQDKILATDLILHKKLFQDWLSTLKFIVLFTDNTKVKIADIYNYDKGDKPGSIALNPFYSNYSTYHKGIVWSSGYSGNIIKMAYDGTTQVQFYRSGTLPSNFFAKQFGKVDTPTSVYKFYDSNTSVMSKILGYDIMKKQVVELDPYEVYHRNKTTSFKRLRTASGPEEKRYSLVETCDWPYDRYVIANLILPYTVDIQNNYAKKLDVTTEQKKYNLLYSSEFINMNLPGEFYQAATNKSKLSKCIDLHKNVDVVKVKNTTFVLFFLKGLLTDGTTVGNNFKYTPCNGNTLIDTKTIDKSTDAAVKNAYNEFLKTEYAVTNTDDDSGVKNAIKSLDLHIKPWLNAYSRNSSYNAPDYDPNKTINLDYLAAKPSPSNCWNIGHDCTIIVNGNVTVKWTEKTKAFK